MKTRSDLDYIIVLGAHVNGTKLTAKRTLNEAEVRVGEKVDVFVYKIFVTKGNSVYILDNEAINEDSFII